MRSCIVHYDMSFFVSTRNQLVVMVTTSFGGHLPSFGYRAMTIDSKMQLGLTLIVAPSIIFFRELTVSHTSWKDCCQSPICLLLKERHFYCLQKNMFFALRKISAGNVGVPLAALKKRQQPKQCNKWQDHTDWTEQ